MAFLTTELNIITIVLIVLIVLNCTSSLIGQELERLVAVVALWLSGYGGYSQTPWVRVPQLLFFFLFFLTEWVEFQRNFYELNIVIN